jgi:hypothetical protein
MQDVPYQNPGGIAVRPDPSDSNCPGSVCREWRRDVRDPATGTAFRDANGNLQWQIISNDPYDTGREADITQAIGGNHPSSKLYQAKQALNIILQDLENVNLGFATYLSERQPRVGAKYYREIAGSTRTYPTRWQVLASNHPTQKYMKLYPSDDCFTWSGQRRCGGVGYLFTLHETHWALNTGCTKEPIQKVWEVTSITEKLGSDGQKLGYNWSFKTIFNNYGIITISDQNHDPDCPADGQWHQDYNAIGQCDPSVLPQDLAGSWWRVTSGYGCNLWRKLAPTSYLVEGYYTYTWLVTTGTWSKAEGEPGYIDPATYAVIPFPLKDAWTLVPPGGLLNVKLHSSRGSITDLLPDQYADDQFRYPGIGNDARPHAWSYVRRDPVPQGDWPDAIQKFYFPDQEYFPAAAGDEGGNLVGDDHIIFLNLPPADSNDLSMAHRDRILEFVTLERYSGHPRYTNRYFTTAPHTRAVPPNVLTAVAGRATPLAASLRYAKRYYESYIRQDSQSQNACRFNYLILLTDGLDTADCDPLVDYTNCTAPIEAATDLRNLSINELGYPVKTYVIGFGLEDAQISYLDQLAAAGGTTSAYFAFTAHELANALGQIFQEITAGRYSRSDLALSRDGNRIYTSYFHYPGWAGHLKGFQMEEDGSVGDVVTTWGYDSPCPFPGFETDLNPCRGDAGSSLNEQPNRTVYTTVDNQGLFAILYNAGTDDITFDGATSEELATLENLLIDNTEDIDGDGSPGTGQDARTVLQFIMNPGYDSGTYAGTRNPDWKLADLYHTTPVVVGPPPFFIPWGGYQDFKTLHSQRDTMIYVGGNGGMLHAFNTRSFNVDGELVDADGTERWAFIPKMALSGLKNLRQEHQFFVDAKPSITDIYSEGGVDKVFGEAPAEPKYGWHTVLISGMRDGGMGYFALEVTDPDNPQVLWEITDDNMGYTWSTPTTGRVRVNGEDRWVTFVGGGWDPGAADVGNRLYIIDVERGVILAEYVIGGPYNRVASAIQDVDLNRDGYIERIYFGDTDGILWRMDLSSETMADWIPCILLDPESYDFSSLHLAMAPARRPIYHAPAVTRGDNGNYFVFFGTGDEHQPNSTGSQDFFYEVEDTSSTPDGAIPPNCTGKVNWVEDAFEAGEKVLARPVVFNYVVYFTTYVPSPDCQAGRGYLWGLTMSRGVDSEDGGEAGLEFDEEGNRRHTPVRRMDIGAGVPSAPVVTNGNVYVSTSNRAGQRESIKQIKIDSIYGVMRGWRELF